MQADEAIHMPRRRVAETSGQTSSFFDVLGVASFVKALRGPFGRKRCRAEEAGRTRPPDTLTLTLVVG
jgi:hypothetical protein